jgi:predicted CXXCH cytochrome family protein
MNPATGIDRRSEPLNSQELDICAGCHSRRKVIAKDSPVGAAFLDSDLPALLDAGLYHADGQIDGEVFEYRSFVQSRMYHAGVTCSDCHEPHSLALREQGNGLCAQCHLSAKFDVVEHLHHQQGSAGAQCVNCHNPRKPTWWWTTGAITAFASLGRSIGVYRDVQCLPAMPCRQNRRLGPATHRGMVSACPADPAPLWHRAVPGRIGSADAERQLDELIGDQDQPPIARSSAWRCSRP